jgi:membrane protein DedA with SNARE-associated domain
LKEIVELLQSWGPFGAMVLAILDSAGIPLPGGVDALVVLVSITTPEYAIQTAILAIVGSVIGCMFLYWLGRRGGRAYLDRHACSPRAMRFRRWFDQYGLLTVFIPALVPIPLPVKVFVLSAGCLGTRPLSLLGVVLAARIPRYFGLAWLGAQMGTDAGPWVKSHVWHLTAFALALFAILYLMIRMRASSAPRQS